MSNVAAGSSDVNPELHRYFFKQWVRVMRLLTANSCTLPVQRLLRPGRTFYLDRSSTPRPTDLPSSQGHTFFESCILFTDFHRPLLKCDALAPPSDFSAPHLDVGCASQGGRAIVSRCAAQASRLGGDRSRVVYLI